MVDLSSSLDEEDLIPDTSWDEEFTKKIFSDLNRDVLGPPDDGNIIILTDSDEEEDVRKEDVTNIEVMPSSTARILASTASTADTDEAPRGYKMIIVVIAPPIRKLTVAATVEMKLIRLRLPCQGDTCREACFKENSHDFALLHHNFFCKEGW
jgi:hypothetical protein